ncbi:MAG TPA: hypothetical protein PK760_01040 [Flavobacteriales bacterium]|nr:hypothetical protein [Flavobacteriales bacterium]
MPSFHLIPKERIPSLRFPRQPLPLTMAEHDSIMGKLLWATRLGNGEPGKCRILFQDDEDVKAVETTVWAFDTENIVLKYGMTIPIARVVDVEIP